MERINKQEIYNFYNRKSKWMGLIDYKTMVVLLIYFFIILKIVISLNIKIILRVYIISILLTPAVVFIILNFNEECIVDKLLVILKYCMNKGIYIKEMEKGTVGTVYKKNVKR